MLRSTQAGPEATMHHPRYPALALAYLLPVLLPFILIACVGTTTQLAPLPQGAVEAEQEKQRELALVEYGQQQARLDDITFPMLARGTSLCPQDVGPRLGVRVATIHDYDREYQPAAARVLHLSSDTLTILSVSSAGATARAGFLPGDRIVAVGGKRVVQVAGSAKAFTKLMAEYQGDREVSVLVQRGMEPHRAAIRPDQVCDYGAVVVNSNELNAYADGKAIYLTSAMMRFVNDEELRIVVAHELAHNAMGHMKAKKKNSLFGALLGALGDLAMASRGVNTGGYYTSKGANIGAMTFSQDFEREADYVGIYALALADLPVTAAPNFWRRMAIADPKAIGFAHSHPTTAERFVRLEQAIGEVNQKIASKQALQPDLRGSPKPLPEPERSLARATPSSGTPTVSGGAETLLVPEPDLGLTASEAAPLSQGYQAPPTAEPAPVDAGWSDKTLSPSAAPPMEVRAQARDWLGQPHGRIYYQALCQAARELPEPIYFKSEQEAQELGYQRSLVPGC
jgi:Zn-dependent protease with chaperone function